MKIDVGDVNSVLSAILVERTDDQYDVNNDGAVDVGDVNSVLAEILSPTRFYMTIAEFKTAYWHDDVNYCDTVKSDIVIHGRVTRRPCCLYSSV